MYGFVQVANNHEITGVSVKRPISNTPFNDHAIVGAFTFKKVRYFLEAHEWLHKKNIRINNEFYIDSCIEALLAKGLNVKAFEVTHYLCWGTPPDYQTFTYWQSFFHKCWWHPYRLDTDPTVPKEAIARLDRLYKKGNQQADDDQPLSHLSAKDNAEHDGASCHR